MNRHLIRRTVNSDADVIGAVDDGIRVAQELQAVLEEGWLDRNKFLELRQGQRLLQQLPGRILWKVRVDELRWSRHEVVLVEFIANVVRSQLSTSTIDKTISTTNAFTKT